MAMTLTGFVYDNAGNAISGATVQGYVSADNATTTAEASTTTDSNGKWSITTSTAARIPMDVKITYGSNIRWIKAGDKVNITDMTVTGTLTVGEDAAGFDFSLFSSDTSGDGLTWDASEEVLQITGKDANTALDVLDGDVRIVDKLYFYDRGGEYLSSDGSTLTITGATTVSGGLTSTAASNTFGATSFNDASITNVNDIALDSISADGTDINVAVSDNSATSFTVKQGSDAYLIIDTANSSESVSIGTGISGTAITLGHSTSEVTVADNLTVTGDLTVSGTTTTVDTTNTTIKDVLIKLGQGTTADPSSSVIDLGIIFTRGNGSASNIANRAILWDESADQFAFAFTNDEDGTTSGNVDIDDYADIKVGNVIVEDEVQTANIGYTDGDNSMTIADGGKVTFAAGFDVGSDASGDILYHNGTSYVRLARGSDDEVLTLASGVPSWAAATTGDITGVTAGVGLSGGGSTGGVTLTLDLSELSDVTPVNGDKLATLDSDGSTEQLTTVASLATLFAGTGLTASSSVIGVDASQAITALTGGDLTIYEDANNADVSLKMGTSATEALTIQVLNGGSNKTAEEVHFSTATASGTADHGKMVFDIDGTDIATIDDGGVNVTSGSLETATIDYTDGDLAMTIADGGGVTFAQNATFSGIIDVTDTTDASDATGDTGALRTEGGASIAKKLYVGTDLDVDGTAELDNITIAGAQGSDGQVLTSTGSGVGWEDAGGGGGITHASQWRVNSTATDDLDPVVNWEVVDTDGYAGITTAGNMTESSGVFTFPATGVYKIDFFLAVYQNGTNQNAFSTFIETATDGSTFTEAVRARNNLGASGEATNTAVSFIFDVTATATHKVQFKTAYLPSNAIINASTSRSQTYATFIRLGDTNG